MMPPTPPLLPDTSIDNPAEAPQELPPQGGPSSRPMRRQQYRENGRFAREPKRKTWNPGDEEREDEGEAQQEAAQRGRPKAKAGPKAKAKANVALKGKAKAQAKAEAQPPVDPASRRRASSSEAGAPKRHITRKAKSADNVRAPPTQSNPEPDPPLRKGAKRVLPPTCATAADFGTSASSRAQPKK